MGCVREPRTHRAVVAGWVVVGLLLLCGPMGAGEEAGEHSALGVRFVTPVPFSAPESIGMDTVAVRTFADGPADLGETVMAALAGSLAEEAAGD